MATLRRDSDSCGRHSKHASTAWAEDTGWLRLCLPEFIDVDDRDLVHGPRSCWLPQPGAATGEFGGLAAELRRRRQGRRGRARRRPPARPETAAG